MSEAQESWPGPGRRLERGSEVKIAGVCDGLANYFGIDVTIIRILAVLGIFVSGGLVGAAYLVAWLVMPANSGQPSRSPVVRTDRERNKMIAWALIGVGVLIVVPQFRWFGWSVFPMVLIGGGVFLLLREPDASEKEPDSPTIDTEDTIDTHDQEPQATPDEAHDEAPEEPSAPAIKPEATTVKAQTPLDVAVVTKQVPSPPKTPMPDSGFPMTPFVVSALSVVLGIGLLGHLNDWWTLSLSQAFAATLLASGAGLLVAAFTGRAPGLIVLGLIALVGLGSSWILDPIIQDGAGSRFDEVLTIDGLEDEYRLGAGELTLDLRGLDLEGTQQKVTAHLAAGSLTIYAPPNVDLIISAKALAGEVRVGQEIDSGFKPNVEREIDTPSNAQLIIEAEVSFGEVQVRS